VQLILIRHAEPLRAEAPAGGRADPALTAQGRAQAGRLADWLGEEKIAAVWSSPQRRARETAEPLARVHGLPVAVDEDLAEYDRQLADYVPVEELRASGHPRWRAMVAGRWEEIASVDLPTFRARVRAAMERRIAAHPGGRVAVVCHGGVINVYVGLLLGIERPLWFDPGYTSVSRIAASRSGVRSLVSLNELAHLRATSPPGARGDPRARVRPASAPPLRGEDPGIG
jgi:probable phosphoglycerate mutase